MTPIRIREQCLPTGTWTIEVRSARTGRLLKRERVTNVILDQGAAIFAKQSGGQTPLYIKALAAGTSNQAAVASQTALTDERFRGALTSAIPAGRSITYRFVMGTQQGNGFTYAEVGLATSTTKGAVDDVLINRAVVTPVAKNDSKTITYACTITY